MSKAIVLLFLIFGQALLASGVQSKSYYAVGQRIEGDQLLMKDVQHSRPAGTNEPASVTFNYNIVEPITYIEIVSEEDISADVKFSYIDSLVVGMVSLTSYNISQCVLDCENAQLEFSPAAFDVTITIFGYNKSILNINPAMLLHRDASFEGKLTTNDDYEDLGEEFTSEVSGSVKRKELQEDKEDSEQTTDGPAYHPDFEFKDKIIEVGQRQEGDDLIYETYQTSPDVSREQTNHTIIFYYIDSDFITYVKFVIFDHFADKVSTSEDYTAPVAEYSHYSPGTLKATITDFNISSLFVQMFVYGYHGSKAPPEYKPFLPPPHWHRLQDQDVEERAPELTPMQKVQLLLLTGSSTTSSPPAEDDDDDEDYVPHAIRPEDMVPDHIPNAALDQQKPVEQRLYAMLGLMLFAVA